MNIDKAQFLVWLRTRIRKERPGDYPVRQELLNLAEQLETELEKELRGEANEHRQGPSKA